MMMASCSQARSLSPDPGSDHRQILDQCRPTSIFFHRQKLDRVPAFAQRFFFSAQGGID